MEIEDVLDPSGFWTVVGILLGFALTVGYSTGKYWCETRRLKRSLVDELKAIQKQLVDKRDILEQVLQRLQEGKLLPADSVHSPSNIYRTHLGRVGHHLLPEQRECLHNIYERQRILDLHMDNLRSNYVEMTSNGVFADPEAAMLSQVNDLIESCAVVDRFITIYLAGSSIAIFGHNEKKADDHKK